MDNTSAVLCNACSAIISHDHEHQDCLHFCSECSDVMEENSLVFIGQNKPCVAELKDK